MDPALTISIISILIVLAIAWNVFGHKDDDDESATPGDAERE